MDSCTLNKRQNAILEIYVIDYSHPRVYALFIMNTTPIMAQNNLYTPSKT